MAQNDDWDSLFPAVGKTAPSADPIIKRAPVEKGPTPFQVEDQEWQRKDRERKDAEWKASHNPDGSEKPKDLATGKPTEAQAKIATLLTRIAGGFKDIQGVTATDKEAQEPGYIESLRGGLDPGGVLGTPVRAIAGADRRIVHDSQRDVLDALLTMGTGAAYNPEQLSGAMTSHFPQYNDSPEEIAVKNQRLLRLIEAAKANAGPAWAPVEQAIAPFMQNLSGNTAEARDPNAAYDDQGNIIGLAGEVHDDTPRPGDPVPPADDVRVRKLSSMDGDQSGMGGLGTLAKHGLTLGLDDEAAGVGGAIAAMFTGKDPTQEYYTNRDARSMTVDRARGQWGGLGTAAEFMGGMSLPAKALAALPTIGQAAKTGATAGALSGFGYGRGGVDSATGAVAGAATGAALGAGVQAAAPMVANGVNALTGRMANRAVPTEIAARANVVNQAGKAEGVTINRAMVDPRLQNRVTGVDASMAGGPRVQNDMRAIEGQIGSRVQALGQGGRPMNEQRGGDTVLRAGQRAIDKTGASARAKYNRAETLAGDTKVAPAQSAKAVDDMITDLGEMPGSNSKELAFLESLKGDLGKDLSVSGLRRLRTKLRKQISRGELVFGEDEARVLGIMDTAADDIRTGLQAQGKTAAANAFDAADKSYRARMEYIGGTVQRIMGKRNNNLPAESAWKKFAGMANTGGDARGLRKFYASLAPDERADVAATFANDLGKNNAGEFSTSHFLSQTENLSDDAVRTIFGPEGAKSIANLRTLATESKRVTSSMNSRKSGTAVGNDFRSWLFNAILGGGSGALAGGSGAMAIGGAATAMGVKAGRDVLSARALMSPDLTKWLRQTPRTTSPAAINAHLAKVPSSVMDAKALQDYLRATVASSPGRAAAEEKADTRRKPPN